mgnify:CR=1 FL=1
MYNDLFGLHLEKGLGATTKHASMVRETELHVYWDAPGINKDFGFYKHEHLGFFQSMSKVLILFDRDVDDIHFILALFCKMKIPRAIVRNKCDTWEDGMRPLADQLEIDLKEVKKYDMEYTKVLASGKGMRNDIKKELL